MSAILDLVKARDAANDALTEAVHLCGGVKSDWGYRFPYWPETVDATRVNTAGEIELLLLTERDADGDAESAWVPASVVDAALEAGGNGPVQAWWDAVVADKKAREAEARSKTAEQVEAQERATLARLKAKYGDV